jgi:pimeloyl-ACP methyl ester carboxylesterase/DNA-binding transcriptional LysR family regulator/AraC-like DNA-binding protein
LDVLDEILGSLRLTGGVVIDGEFGGDFCVHAEFTPNHCAPFFPLPEKLIAYHYVRSGRMIIEVDGQPPVALGPGSVAILPRNNPHLLANRHGIAPAEKAEIAWITEDGIHRVSSGNGEPKAEVWCGFLGTSKSNFHPLLDALPPLLTIDLSGGEAQWLDSSMRFLAEQTPSPEIVAKLAELFLSQAIRDYLQRLPADSTGWLRGLADPAVSKALSIIHTCYAEELEVEGIAREAGVSRTVLGERFGELLGEPPMRYCGRWRMRVASNMLREGKQNSANIAYAVGFNSEAAFNRAFKREFGKPPAKWKRLVEAEEAEAAERLKREKLPAQQVRYCTGFDGTRLAWSAVGSGPPLVKTANWLNHIEFDWESPVWKHWLLELTDGRTLIRYDERGNGLSDWETPELSLDAFVDDLESVGEAAGVERFDLLGISQGAAVAIAYSLRHPGRVRKMILYGGYARGWAHRLEGDELARREAMTTLSRTGWGSDTPAYRQLFTNVYIPDASPEQMDWFNELQRKSTSPENAEKLQQVLSKFDVSDLLAKVSVPTLVLHATGDQAVPFSSGEELAKGIPGAQFVALEGRNHILLENEPAWKEFAQATRQFLDGDGAPLAPAKPIAWKRPERRATLESADGTKIAYAVNGSGFPVFKAPNWMTSLDLDWSNPVYGHWHEFGREMGQLVRMDSRGFGMSQWDADLSFDAIVADMEAVADAAGVEQCDMIGISHGATFAMAYAARNPERVRKLVLVNSFPSGWRVRGDPEEIAWRESLLEMNRRQASFRRSLLGEMFVTLYFPSASNELIAWHNEHLPALGSPANMERMIELGSMIDVREALPKIRAETLVFHSDRDGNASIAVGRQVAESIAGARFVELDSANHVLLADEPAWQVFRQEAKAFLRSGERPSPMKEAKTDPRPNQLVISGTPTGVNWVTRRIDEFLGANPDLSVELIPDPQMVDFETDLADCAIRCGTRRPTGLAVEDLFTVDFIPACSPEFLDRHPQLKKPKGLLEVARITPTDPWWPQVWRHFGLKAPPSEQRGVVMGAQVLDGLAALRGQGVALLTPLFWSEEIAAGSLVCPFPDRLNGGGAYWLVYPQERSGWDKIRRFSDWLHDLCARAQAEAA